MNYVSFTYHLRIKFARTYEIKRQYCRLMIFDIGLITIRNPFNEGRGMLRPYERE